MSKPIKFTADELKQVTEIQDSYFDIQNKFGQLKIAKIRLNNQVDSLNIQEEELHKNLTKIEEGESKFLNGIREKYGEGTLDSKTGEFTPNK